MKKKEWDVPSIGVTTLIVSAATLMSLMAGCVYALNGMMGTMGDELHLKSWQAVLITSWGLIGYYFTLFPAGVAVDAVGPGLPALVSALVMSLAWGLLSLDGVHIPVLDEDVSKFLIALGLVILAGFAGGAVFTSALSAGLKSMPSYPGIAVSIVGSAFSLSLALSNQILLGYEKIFCSSTSSGCWRGQARVFGILCLLMCVTGGAVVLFGFEVRKRLPSVKQALQDEEAEESLLHVAHSSSVSTVRREDEDRPILDSRDETAMVYQYTTQYLPMEEDEPAQPPSRVYRIILRSLIAVDAMAQPASYPLTTAQSFWVLLNPFFLVFLVSCFVGVSSGVLILAGSTQILDGYDDLGANWVFAVSTAFSVLNALTGLVLGWLSDFCWFKLRICRHYLFAAALLFGCIVYAVLGVLDVLPVRTPATAIVFSCLLVAPAVVFASTTSSPMIVSQYYGFKNFGKVFGFLQFGPTLGALVSPNIASLVATHVGGFYPVYFAVSAMSFICFVLLVLVPPSPILKKNALFPSRS